VCVCVYIYMFMGRLMDGNTGSGAIQGYSMLS